MSDIVQRLRGRAMEEVASQASLLIEAANEIERLRVELAKNILLRPWDRPPIFEKTWFPGDTIHTVDGKKYRVHHAMTAVEES